MDLERYSAQIAARHKWGIDVAQRAAAMLMQATGSVLVIEQKSSMTGVATQTDVEIERFIVSEILRTFPDDGVFGEEGSTRAGVSGFDWIIDPLDGTANFVRNLHTSCVSMALALEGFVVAGIVVDPFGGDLFEAAARQGARWNGRQLLSSGEHHGDIGRSFVGVSGSNRHGVRAFRASLVARLIERADSVRDVGSTALSLCWTAAGRYDAHVGVDVAWWDFAAGVLIAREAGCRATALAGSGDPEPAGFIVAPQRLFVAVQAEVATALSIRQ